jgi:Family of unknown function (DUF6174)
MNPDNDRTGGRRRGRRFWGWLAVGLAIGGVVGLTIARKPGGALTAERLAEARARWAAAGPKSYTLELQLRGAVEDERHIVVRDSKVVEMTTGGAPVPEAAWSYWTVEGMFGFLDEELRNAAHPKRTYGVDDPRRVVLRAAFDRRRGYPSFFLRHVLGSQQSVEWTVTRFQAN